MTAMPGVTSAEIIGLLENVDRLAAQVVAARRGRDAARAGGLVAVARDAWRPTVALPRLVANTDVLRYDEPARILDGRPLAARSSSASSAKSASFKGRYGFAPDLSAVMVGHQVASSVYVQQILRSCKSVGIPSRVIELPRDGHGR